MKKIILFSMLLIGAGLACRKSNSGGSYHITATIDGKNETFNVNAMASRITYLGPPEIAIGGLATSTPTGEAVQIQLITLAGGPAITTGTYTDTTSQYRVFAGYWVNSYHPYATGTATYQATLGGASPRITNHLKLVITAMDSTSIKGTFSGDYFANGSPDSAIKTVTNGDFYLPLH